VLPLRSACDHCALPALCRIDAATLREALASPADAGDADD
jgi:hypothetical protein